MTRVWRTLSRNDLVRLRSDSEFQLYDRLRRGRALEVRSADGTMIHTEVFGPEHGYPIVLTHGICCAIEFWAHQIAELSTEYRVIAFDHRGHGRSGRPGRDGWTADHLADDLSAVLRHTLGSGERALIAGHSMGGIAIQAWANRHPGEVPRFADSIALVDTTAGDLGKAIGAAAGALPKPLAALTDLVLPVALRSLGGVPVPTRLPFRSALMSPVAIGSTATPAARALVQELILTTPAHTRGRFLRMLLAVREGQFDASRLAVPTLVIGSAGDRLLGFASARRLAASLPDPRGLVKLPGGHCGPLEQPDSVTAELRELIALGRARTA